LEKLKAIAVLDCGDEETLNDHVLELSIKLIMHSDYEPRRSALLYFCGILGYDVKAHQWLRPDRYTPIVAGLQCCIRLIKLEYAVPLRTRNQFRELYSADPLTVFKSVRRDWLVDGEPSPFNAMHKLLN